MSFRQLREQTVLDVHLEPSNFAETVTYTPTDGSPVSVTIHAESDSDYRVQDQLTGEEIDELIVMCSRNPVAAATDGTLRRGIDNPRIGDTILRSSVDDPRQEVYTFAGEIRDQKRYKWRLVFKRRARPEQGIPD